MTETDARRRWCLHAPDSIVAVVIPVVASLAPIDSGQSTRSVLPVTEEYMDVLVISRRSG
jgi:hypothetical protein